VTDTLAAAPGRGYRVERDLGQRGMRARMGAEP
jgi:hypothetical protein